MATATKLGIVSGQPRLEAADIQLLAKAARELPVEELPDFIGRLESIKATAWARLTAPSPTTAQPHDELLDVTEAARRLGVSKDYLYRHAKDYSFTRKVGSKLLFSALGIEKHIRQQKT